MEIRNNNTQVEKELAQVYDRKNRRRNAILVSAIALSFVLLYAVCAIAAGKLRANYLIDVRGMGTLATVSLENGSEKQYNQMKSLPYLSEIGLKKTVTEGEGANHWKGRLVYVDETAYEKMLKPAYTDIHGAYPQEADEIMLPFRCLQQLGIEKPELGQRIAVMVGLEDARERKEFRLAGYYTDYIDAAIAIPEAYVSRAFLEERDCTPFPADRIMAVSRSLTSGAELERRIYFDIDMEQDSQQVFGENPMVLQSVEGFAGSVSILSGCGLLVIACAFLLLYQVISISEAKNVQEYGLLKVIGTTDRQLKRIVYRQTIWNIGRGVLAGGLIGVGAVAVFLKKVLEKLFMRGYGTCEVDIVYPGYLAASGLLIAATVFLAAGMALRQVLRRNAIDSLYYVESDLQRRKTKPEREKAGSAWGSSFFCMAWRNVTRSKKRLVFSSLSLVLGVTTALASAVLMTGTDLRNRYEQNPDFRVGILAGIFRFPDKVPREIHDDTPVLSEEMLHAIYELDGIDVESIDPVTGSYAVINFDKDEAFWPRKKSIESTSDPWKFATIQVVSDTYAEELADYVEDCDLEADMDSFRNGTGCILLHYHEMSQILDEQAEKVSGMPIHFYSLSAWGQTGDLDRYRKAPLSCAGYLDCTAKYFPKLATTTMGNYINYFIMTEAAFRKLELPEKVFDLSFDAKDGQEALVNQKLSQIVQEANRKGGVMDTYYLEAEYMQMEIEQNRIRTGNAMLGAMTLVILLAGILNFLNTLAANYTARKRELAVMESIGLTGKQLWKLLFWEGFCYWLITVAGTLSAGSAVIVALGTLIRQRLLYFRFVYPWKQLVFLAVSLLLLNVAFAGCLSRKDRKETLIDRMKL